MSLWGSATPSLPQATAQGTVNPVSGMCAPQEGLVPLFTRVRVPGRRSGCRTDLSTVVQPDGLPPCIKWPEGQPELAHLLPTLKLPSQTMVVFISTLDH